MDLTFNFTSIPHIIFGARKLNELYNIIPKFGKNVLYVIGGKSLKESGKWDEIVNAMEKKSINISIISVYGEPTPTLIDEAVAKYKSKNIDLVVGIGGGSVTDAGKAISAMISKEDSIMNYLEGVGNKIHDGEKIPYIAIPTTSGTGSEATKNAVISEVGPEGFKKSLRHDNLIPDYAIIDPELVLSSPSSVSAACGMDAFTQLLEAYVSPRANPITDALAFTGMRYVKDAIIPACSTHALDIGVRSAMAYGSLMSGIALANAGLGIVHGLASSLGGLFEIPHGVACGTLLAESTKMNITQLQKIGDVGKKGLLKYAMVGALLADKEGYENVDVAYYCSILIETLEKWTNDLNIDRLGKYGIIIKEIDKIVEKAGLKNNPVQLKRKDIIEIVRNRI